MRVWTSHATCLLKVNVFLSPSKTKVYDSLFCIRRCNVPGHAGEVVASAERGFTPGFYSSYGSSHNRTSTCTWDVDVLLSKSRVLLGSTHFPATKFLRMVTAKTLPAEVCKIWCLQTISATRRLHLREITEAGTGISTVHVGRIPWNRALLRKGGRVPVDRTWWWK
jgi:hypothetical protein